MAAIYCLMVLEAPKSEIRVLAGPCSLKPLGEEAPCLFLASGGCWHTWWSLAPSCSTLVSAFVVTRQNMPPTPVCLCLFLWHQPPHSSTTSSELVTSAVTLFLHQVTVRDTGVRTSAYLFFKGGWGHNFTHESIAQKPSRWTRAALVTGEPWDLMTKAGAWLRNVGFQTSAFSSATDTELLLNLPLHLSGDKSTQQIVTNIQQDDVWKAPSMAGYLGTTWPSCGCSWLLSCWLQVEPHPVFIEMTKQEEGPWNIYPLAK